METLKVTPEVKDILNKYDVNKVLSTIPKDYEVTLSALASYNRTIKETEIIKINDLSEENHNWLSAIAKNNNTSFALVFNFLIECVANLGKITSKKVSEALNCYYLAVIDASRGNNYFLSKILEGYVQSGFYYEEIGLSEEGIANFLTITKERKRFNSRNERPGSKSFPVFLLFYLSNELYKKPNKN